MKAYYIVFLLILFSACICKAAPEPAVVQGAEEWTLDMKFEHLGHISVPTELIKMKGQRDFWYLILSITNNTGREVGFYPNCELMTDTFQIVPAGNDVPSIVFQRIKERHEKQYPFLESLENTDDKVLQGKDNTKDIAVIFSDFDHKAKNIKLFIAGLSNETAVVEHPVKTDENGQPVKVFLRKTLEINYSLGGDPDFRAQQKLTFKKTKWVMR